MNWGKSIILVFILFSIFIGFLVAVCLRQDTPLVAADYYEQELLFQHQIDRVNNTRSLVVKPVIQLVDKHLEIQFSRFAEVTEGNLELFRPSDARLDRHYRIDKSREEIQRIDLSALSAGMYKARMLWSMDGKDYFIEDIIYLQ